MTSSVVCVGTSQNKKQLHVSFVSVDKYICNLVLSTTAVLSIEYLPVGNAHVCSFKHTNIMTLSVVCVCVGTSQNEKQLH